MGFDARDGGYRRRKNGTLEFLLAQGFGLVANTRRGWQVVEVDIVKLEDSFRTFVDMR